MAEAFELTGTLETITLGVNDPDGGEITVNTVTPEFADGQWSGSYYTDYPVTITAKPRLDYEFLGWYHNGELYEEVSQVITLEKGENLWTAEFRKIGE